MKNSHVVLKFHQMRPPVSESEQLDALKKRQELGIASTVDLLMIDNPDLSKEEAEKKAQEILEERKANQDSFMQDGAPVPESGEAEGELEKPEEEDAQNG